MKRKNKNTILSRLAFNFGVPIIFRLFDFFIQFGFGKWIVRWVPRIGHPIILASTDIKFFLRTTCKHGNAHNNYNNSFHGFDFITQKYNFSING